VDGHGSNLSADADDLKLSGRFPLESEALGRIAARRIRGGKTFLRMPIGR
jgi:hypothetical protein